MIADLRDERRKMREEKKTDQKKREGTMLKEDEERGQREWPALSVTGLGGP